MSQPSEQSDRHGPAELPDAVRSRLVALVSRGLPMMLSNQVPAPLRKGASFTPSKRARLLGSQIVDRVGSDADFRGHLAAQVRALEPDLVDAVETGRKVATDRLAEAAAVAYILRTGDWADLIQRAAESEARRAAAAPELSGTVERLAGALDQSKGDLRAAREKYRAQLDQVKGENAQLRRTLGQTRVQLKEAEDRATQLAESAVAADRKSAELTRSLEAEIRRLKGRIADLESDTASARRAARDDRSAEVMRLRLLLDTVTDAAAGIKRELALPPGDALPAETVDALEPAADSAAVGAGRSMPDDDPALLRRLMELPRVHVIVDGYNVSKTAWPSLPLDQQRNRLVSGLSALVAGKSAETTVVFDGADLASPPAVVSPRGVRVRFSPPGVIADDLIRQLVEAEPVGRPIVVVSTDREVARTVTKKGARAVASMALVRALGG
jgi:predicted RNA-binding protein with PIN domain